MRVAILWSHLSGYLNTCLNSLDTAGHSIFVSSFREDSEAPFATQQFAWIGQRHAHEEWPGGRIVDDRLLESIERFAPDVILISGWHHAAYRKVARCFTGRAVRVLCMDNPWEERSKQWLGRLVAPWYVRPLYDFAFVAGERQYQFARHLDFDDSAIVEGVLTCDAERFAPPMVPFSERPGGFVFVGRLVREKGIEELVSAYRIYRQQNPQGWTLTVAGTGPMQSVVDAEPTVRSAGFVQPENLPALLHASRTLIAPSRWEPWGVQIHEAATAGLPIICTSVCGAAVHLVRDGVNGARVPSADANALAAAMERVAGTPELELWSQRSRGLAAQFSPALWVAKVESMLERAAFNRRCGEARITTAA